MVALVQALPGIVGVKTEEKVLPSALETIDLDKLRVTATVKNESGEEVEASILFPMYVGALRAAFAQKLRMECEGTEEEFISEFGPYFASMRFRRNAHVGSIVIYQEMKSGRLIPINPDFMKKVTAVSLTVEPCTTHFVDEPREPFISKSISSERKGKEG